MHHGDRVSGSLQRPLSGPSRRLANRLAILHHSRTPMRHSRPSVRPAAVTAAGKPRRRTETPTQNYPDMSDVPRSFQHAAVPYANGHVGPVDFSKRRRNSGDCGKPDRCFLLEAIPERQRLIHGVEQLDDPAPELLDLPLSDSQRGIRTAAACSRRAGPDHRIFTPSLTNSRVGNGI